MPPIDAEAMLMLIALAEKLPWVFGMIVLALYYKPILAALQRTTRDPLVEVAQEQNRHFAENNVMFKALGPALNEVAANTKEAVHQQQEILHVLREIEKQLIRAGANK